MQFFKHDAGVIPSNVDINCLLEQNEKALVDYFPKFVDLVKKAHPGIPLIGSFNAMEFFVEQKGVEGISRLSRHITQVPYFQANYAGKEWLAYLVVEDNYVVLKTNTSWHNPFNFP